MCATYLGLKVTKKKSALYMTALTGFGCLIPGGHPNSRYGVCAMYIQGTRVPEGAKGTTLMTCLITLLYYVYG